MKDLFPNNGKNSINQSNKKPQKLTLAALANDKKLPESFLKEFGVIQENNYLQLTYYFENGKKAQRHRKRTSLQAKEGSSWLGNKKDKILPYGLQKLKDAIKKGYIILIEGESDTWTLWFHHYPALGIPGASMTHTLNAEHLKDISKLYIINEGGLGGKTFINGIYKRLQEIKWSGEAFVISMPQGAEDANDLHKLNSDKFKELFQFSLQKATPIKKTISFEDNEETSLEPLLKKEDILLHFDSLHPVFKSYTSSFQGKTEIAIEYIATTFLVSLATIMGNRIRLPMGDKKLRANLYAMIIGPSTLSGKSTALNLGTISLREMNKEKRKKYEEELKIYEANLTENETKKAKSDIKPPKNENFIYPESITPEQLIARMQDKSDGMFLLYEMGAFLKKMETGYAGSLKHDLTSMYDGNEFERETKTSGRFYIEEPSPSILAASTFQWLQPHLKDLDLRSGFLGRFLYVIRRNYSKERIAFMKPIKLEKEWQRLFKKIEMITLDLELSKEAEEFHENWYNSFFDEIEQLEEDFHSPLARLLRETCHKIAMINHTLDCVFNDVKDSHVIQKRSYEQAYPWIDFFKQNVISCYPELTQQENIKERKILEVIEKYGKTNGNLKELNQRNTVRRCGRIFKDAQELRNVCEMLSLKGQLKIHTKKSHTYYQIATT